MTLTRTIQDASTETGVSRDTLRYYERVAILPGIARSRSGLRRFSDDDMGWIKLVQCLRATGMPIEDLQAYAELMQQGDSTAGERLAGGWGMATCPECDADIEVDEYDVDKGDLITCQECGSALEVVSVSPVELEAAAEEDEDELDEDEDEDEDEEDEEEDWDE